MKLALVVLLLLQSVVYAGPVCGNHSSTAESMDCCEKGHTDGTDPGVQDSHAAACCTSCDMGKATGITPRSKTLSGHSDAPFAILPSNILANISTIAQTTGLRTDSPQYFPSPPQIFLLDRSFRI